MIRLHDNLSSGNGYKARLLLAQLDIPFEHVEYDIVAGEARARGFLEKVNPNGRVPVLELEDGTTLPESNAILFYLAENIPFLPEGRCKSCVGCSLSSTAELHRIPELRFSGLLTEDGTERIELAKA